MFPYRKRKKLLTDPQARRIQAAKDSELVEASDERNVRIMQSIKRQLAIPAVIGEVAAACAWGTIATHEFSQGDVVNGIGSVAMTAALALDAGYIYRAKTNGKYDIAPDQMFIPTEWQDKSE